MIHVLDIVLKRRRHVMSYDRIIKDPPIPGSFKKEDYKRTVEEAMKSNDWYSENIEEPLKDLIKYLRNNGVNTECSCGHELYIQCQYIPEGWIKMVHDLLYNYLHKHDKKINYEIHVHHKVDDGHSFSTMEIKL